MRKDISDHAVERQRLFMCSFAYHTDTCRGLYVCLQLKVDKYAFKRFFFEALL